ncbi:MAG: hypothetical protein GY821_16525, partial [Gammaproteobacteria bacterium]|nr:hypothetical protein [Gammaproteobacteria bacterium]
KVGSQTAKELLANADNNNRPNTNCYERSQQVDESGTTAVHKSVDDSMTKSLSQLRNVLNNIVAEIKSEVKQQSDRMRSDMKELVEVVDHDIMKRDQESDRINQKLLESEKTTDKFKNDPPALNVFSAPKHSLCAVTSDWAPDPLVQVLPIQCVKVPRFKIQVEGQELECVIDTGAGPALIVPEGLAIQILSVKYGELNEVYKAILPPIGNVEIASCTGGEVPIMGQAVVSVQIKDIKCNTPMLIMKTNNPHAECLLGVYALHQMGFMLFAPTGEELLGQDMSQVPSDKCPKVDAPVKLPKSTHTQVNLLKCYSAKPLELGPLHKGRIKMKVPECDEKGAYLFTPSDEGQAAGLRQSQVLLNKSGQFGLKVANCSMQQSL